MRPAAERLERLGLAQGEAEAYLALLRNGPLTAREVAEVIGSGRTGAYPILYALVERGLAEGGAGYASRFTAVAPESALPNLVARRRESLFNDERVAESLMRDLESFADEATSGAESDVQVLRSQRLVAERFTRLQREAVSSIDVFIKAPFFAQPGNPDEEDVLARGVRCRGLYEEAVLSSDHVAPYLRTWEQRGEEIRLYPGVLPMKLALFDSMVAVMPLEQSGDRGVVTMVIRHGSLGALLRVAFDALWARSRPLEPARARRKKAAVPG